MNYGSIEEWMDGLGEYWIVNDWTRGYRLMDGWIEKDYNGLVEGLERDYPFAY